jgi:4-hydroxy-tetrahydrodipicolinate reductase
MSDRPRLLVVGHGRMGRLVEQLAADYGFAVAAVVSGATNEGGQALTADLCRGVAVAVEFARAPATLSDVRALCRHRVNAVIGTTGWLDDEEAARAAVAEARIGIVASANFSLSANILDTLAERAAGLFEPHPFGAWIHEAHHAAKRDAPSGTALMLQRAMLRGGYGRPIDVSSTRAGAIPGTHTIGFDGPAETLTLTHTVRDRVTFAHGALAAARWVVGRSGWFTMKDVLGLR